MNEEQKARARRYAELMNTIHTAQDEADQLKAFVIQDLFNTLGREAVANVSGLGKLSLSMRKAWKFSPLVKELEQAVKDEQELEKANGVATFDEKPSVMFKRAKEDNEVETVATVDV